MAIMDTIVEGGFTRADLDALPDDGYRHELIDGAFFVTPAPEVPHQDVVLLLAMRLYRSAEEAGLHVVVAPCDVVLGEHTVVEPDILIAPEPAFGDRDLPSPPLLAVEVRSPSTARVDRLVKREVYERAGVASYWLIDPRVPSVTVLELEDDPVPERSAPRTARGPGSTGSGGASEASRRYVERGTASGWQTLVVERPFRVELTPADWLRRARRTDPGR